MKKDKLAAGKIGLFFLIGFMLLQYPWSVSISMALVGTIAAHWVMQAWTDETTSSESVELPFTKTSEQNLFDKSKAGAEVWNKSAQAGSLFGGASYRLKLFKKQQ
ncbi:MAG: hypothetical protein GDA56_32635 [Hormoscilla sp. GM7CHS1pb]|nr:hypothetical protein [Hormoscilla sp. GM7CHS1pb]